jgi:hypothetical protein
MPKDDDDDKIKQLLGDAHDQGALSARSLAALAVVDVGAQIQAGLGVAIDDVVASEVVLVTMMPDDSQSIAQAGNTDAVRDGHNFVLDALRSSKQSGELLAHTRYLNGHVLCPYVALDQAVTMTPANYNPRLGTPLYDSIARKPLTVHQAMFDASVPPRNGYYWKSHYLAGLSDAAIEAAVDHHLQAPQPWSYSLIGQLGGAIADVASDATAYPHREAPYIININGVDDDPAHDDEVIAWARGTFDALAPFSTGGVYVNFVGNEGDERVRAAYGPAYERLARIKARYDPDNVFSTNQNVRPATV